MKLFLDVIAAVTAFSVTVCAALYIVPAEVAKSDDRQPSDGSAPTGRIFADLPVEVPRQVAGDGTRPAMAEEVTEAVARDRTVLDELRNRVVESSAQSMKERSVSILDCLTEVELAGPQKLRFAVDVVSTPAEVAVGRWRFLEVVDGQQLPAAFGPCAEHVMGGEFQVRPVDGLPFPYYRGELTTLYRIPGPANGPSVHE